MTSEYPVYAKSRLRNGATLVSETYPHVKTLSIGVWVRVGSAFESPRESGISHCIEHLLFKGTQKRTAMEIATSLESLGGDLNAFTERELTCYHATVLCEHAEKALEVLSDLVLNPIFDAQEMEKERQVLIQELSMIEDSPDDLIHDTLLDLVWKGQALGRNIIGSRKTLKAFKRKQILDYYANYYQPSNILISVAGGIEHKELLELCEKYFTKSEEGKAVKVPTHVSKDCRFKGGFAKVPSRSEQLHLLLGFTAPSLKQEGRFEALVLSIYLGGGMSSRLFQEVREKAALAYTIESDYIAFERGGLLNFYAQLAPTSLVPCLEIISKELDAVAKTPVETSRLDAIKSQIRGVLLLSHESMETRQEALGRHEFFFGRYFSVEDLIGAVKKVSPESLQALAKKCFKQKNLGWVLTGRLPRRLPKKFLEA